MTSTAIAPAASTALAPRPAAARGFVQLTTLDEAKAFAAILSDSNLVPVAYKNKPGDIVVAMQMGMEIGLPPLQALQNIAVINGRPTVWGDAIPAIVMSQPDCEDFIEEKPTGDDPEKWVATCRIKRRGFTEVVVSFSWADAKRAKLASKEGPWQQYPKRQLQMRARGFASRDTYPDRLRGLILREEALDYDDEALEKNITPAREPQRISETAARPEPTPAAAETKAPAAETKAPASETPSNGNGHTMPPSVARRQKIAATAFVAAKGSRKEYWELKADPDGTFLIADEGLYNQAASCEGTDHRFALTWKLVSRADKTTARLLTQIDLDEEGGGQ